MKRVLILVMIAVISLAIVPVGAWAASIANAIVAYNAAARTVAVEGNLSSGSGNPVTVTVKDPAGNLVWADEKNSGANGHFQFQHQLKENAMEGVYNVIISGKAVSGVINKTFTVGDLSAGIAYLSSLSVGGHAIAGFDPDTIAYEVHAAATTASTTIRAVLEQSEAVLEVNNEIVENDTESEPIVLQSGNNTVTITVTSKDRTNVKLYTVTVVRASAEHPENPAGSGSPEVPGNPNIAGGKVKLTPVAEGKTAKAQISESDLNKAFEQSAPNGKGNKTVTLVIGQAEGAKVYTLELPRAAFHANTGNNLADRHMVIETPVGAVTISNNMIKSQDLGASSQIAISIEEADTSHWSSELREKVGNRPVVELNVYLDGKLVSWTNNQAPVTVSVDYTPTAAELAGPEHIVVWYIDGAGKIVKVPAGKYVAATGKVTFKTTHFSSFAVAYEIKTFADIQQLGWAKKQIEVLASKGIVNGTSATTFNPGASVTRADFLKLLIGALGVSADVESNFDDVATTDYYYEAAGIAKALGISKGVGGNKLNPKSLITRQDMMVMVERAMAIAGKELGGTKNDDPTRFQDAAAIAEYAKESVATLLRNGLIEGEGDRLNPTGYTTRAQAAVLLYRVYNF
jgi:Tfp pilus assembly protein FimT